VALRQHVTFTTPFDAALVERVKQTMTQGVAWLRAVAADVYDLALSIKCMGNLAFNTGNADMAFAKWDDTLMFIKNTLKHNEMMGTCLEVEFLCQIHALGCMVHIEQELFFFSDMSIRLVGHKYEHIPKASAQAENAEKFNKLLGYEAIPVSAIARFYRFLGAAELGLDHPIKAAKAFAKSYKVMSLPKTKHGYDTARAWKDITTIQRK
jgi:hypothetical protein